MAIPRSLPWIEPLALAASIDEPYWALLYSGTRTSYSGRYSYLARNLRERVAGYDFDCFAPRLSANRPCFDNLWIGYLGYGLKHSLEALPADAPNWITLPPLMMMRFATVYRFDHETRELLCWSDGEPPLSPTPLKDISLPEVTALASNMTQAEYLEKAARVIDHIRAGDLYQANLTRKFTGEFSEPPDAFALFRRLCATSPAPYAAFLRLGDTAILSSSPELFLHIDAEGGMRARPIKGTAPRFSDPAQDAASARALAESAKDRAENLMIVDLMRNDFSRAAEFGSVKAESLFEVTAHAAVHHMASVVTGRKRPDCSTFDAVRRCFPPGSMTGAPKIRAMRICSEMETLERGIYSGAIGWFGGDGSCELSVVIRTLILSGRRFEFQVGGGIVADSTREGEFMESMDKARGIMSCLGISPDTLADL